MSSYNELYFRTTGGGAASGNTSGFHVSVNPPTSRRGRPIPVIKTNKIPPIFAVNAGPSTGDVLQILPSENREKTMERYLVSVIRGPHQGEACEVYCDKAKKVVTVISPSRGKQFTCPIADGKTIEYYLDQARQDVASAPKLANEAMHVNETVATPAKRTMQAAEAILKQGGEKVAKTALETGIKAMDKATTTLSFIATLGEHAPNGEIGKMSVEDTVEAVVDFSAKKVFAEGIGKGVAIGATVVFGPVGGLAAGISANIAAEQVYDDFLKDGVQKFGKEFSKFVVEIPRLQMEEAQRDRKMMDMLVKTVGGKIKNLFTLPTQPKSSVPVEFELTTGSGIRMRSERMFDGKLTDVSYPIILDGGGAASSQSMDVTHTDSASNTANVQVLPRTPHQPSSGHGSAIEQPLAATPPPVTRQDNANTPTATTQATRTEPSVTKRNDVPIVREKRPRENEEVEDEKEKKKAKAEVTVPSSLHFQVSQNLVQQGKNALEDLAEYRGKIAERAQIVEAVRAEAVKQGISKTAIDEFARRQEASMRLAKAEERVLTGVAKTEIAAGSVLDTGLKDFQDKMESMPNGAGSTLGGALADTLLHIDRFSSPEAAALNVVSTTATQVASQAARSAVDSTVKAVATEVLGKEIARKIPGVGTAMAVFDIGGAILNSNSLGEAVKKTAEIVVKTGYSVGGALLGQTLIPIPILGAAIGSFFGSLIGSGVVMAMEEETGKEKKS